MCEKEILEILNTIKEKLSEAHSILNIYSNIDIELSNKVKQELIDTQYDLITMDNNVNCLLKSINNI